MDLFGGILLFAFFIYWCKGVVTVRDKLKGDLLGARIEHGEIVIYLDHIYIYNRKGFYAELDTDKGKMLCQFKKGIWIEYNCSMGEDEKICFDDIFVCKKFLLFFHKKTLIEEISPSRLHRMLVRGNLFPSHYNDWIKRMMLMKISYNSVLKKEESLV